MTPANTEKKTIRSDIPGHNCQNGSIGHIAPPSDEARRLVVGRDISLAGQVSACEHLVVEGVVQAEGFTAQRMDILATGLFAGSAEVTDAVIAGRFEGKIAVGGRLIIKSTGQVFGDISYVTLEVEQGAKIEGQMTALVIAVAEGTLAPPQVNDNAPVDNAPAIEETPAQPSAFRRVSGY